MAEFAESALMWDDGSMISFDCGAQAHREWLEWSTPGSDGTRLDLARCLAVARDKLPPVAIICNGAGNFSGWWHRYWPYAGWPSQLAPTSGAMGYGLPAAIAARLRLPDRCVVAVAGDGDFLMTGPELATAGQYGLDLLVIVVDNGSYGTIRMHQEREFPGRVSATDLANPDFAALARAYGGWAARVETADDFAAALDEALGRNGVRLLHCISDIERLNAAGTTVSALRAQP
jgi:acetolactate synthase-1/2/3 large subunit